MHNDPRRPNSQQSERPRPESPPTGSLRRGPLHLYPDRHRASWKGREVSLTLREYAIVERLAQEPGQDMQYRCLYDVVRGSGFSAGVGTDGYQVNVRAFIKRIRRKFRDIDPKFDAIENYPRFGYRWRAKG